MVGIVVLAVGFANPAKEIEGLRELAAQIVQVGDVVVGLGGEQRHAVLLANGAQLPVSTEGARVVIESDLTDGDVVQCYTDCFGVTEGKQLIVSEGVGIESLAKLIAAVVDVRDVDVEAGQTEGFAEFGEEAAGALGGCECAIVV